MPNTKNAALYIRVSTEDQLEFSPEAQKKALLTYAHKNNMQVLDEHIFIEEGRSGKIAEKRPKFMEMVSIAKAHPKPFDEILVHKYDRFARNRNDSILYKNLLRKDCGIRVVSISEPLDDNDPTSILIEALLEAIAEYYSVNLGVEVKKGMTEKALQGGYQSSPPLGYYMTGGRLAIKPDEAETIRFIFNQFLEHNKTPYQLAQILNAMSIKSKRGNEMDKRGVEYILKNPVYIGKTHWTPTEKVKRNVIHPDTITVQGQHEAIIPEDEFNDVAQKLSKIQRKTKRKARPLNECTHWLSGLVKCSNCGRSLAVANALRYPSFQCCGYSHGQCKISHSITIKKLEIAIIGELTTMLAATGKIYELDTVRTSTSQNEIELLKKQLDKLGYRLSRAREAYQTGVDTLDEYKESKIKLEKQKQDLKAEISSVQEEQPVITHEVINKKFASIAELLTSNCDMQTKQKAIRSIVKAIVYHRAASSLDIYYFDM